MAEAGNQRDTWLVAAWPGMGNIAVGAVAYLINKLGARFVRELPGQGVFDLQNVVVKDGMATPGRLPRSLFFEWKNPNNSRDLLIFLGEAQPANHGYAFCHRVLEEATQRKIGRVITFAALATQLHPSNAPRVFGVATERAAIDDLKVLEVSLLQEGQIGGLNGVLLAAAAERKLPGVCLMGELPFFAASIPNPKASLAVLEVFCTMAGIELDFAELRRQAAEIEKALLQLLEKMQEAARQQQDQMEGGEGYTMPEPAEEPESETAAGSPETPKAQEPGLDYATRRRIEAMFEAANKDRTKAVALKQVLDRLGVFKQYEDRFLDLFKKAE